MKKWYKEPLLHFLAIGALIFGLFALVSDQKDVINKNKIIVTTADIERLSDNWSKKWRRPPTETELQGLIESHIKEEVYYREALALGLDQDDTILRRRLMQKMEFLSNDLAELSTPDESELNKFFLDNQEKYKLPARATFTHIYFSLDRRGAQAIEDAKKVLSDIQTAPSPILRAPERGDSFMLQYDFVQETPSEVTRLFGKSFSEQLFKSDINLWQGPIESGYGLHLVRINEKIDSRIPEFSLVREQVHNDFMYKSRRDVNEKVYKGLKDRYDIVIEEIPKQSGIVKAVRPDRETS
jgi:hypothetical protein